MEINFQDQLKRLQDQLEDGKKELKEEIICGKRSEVSLFEHQIELDRKFEEIKGLKDQAHKILE